MPKLDFDPLALRRSLNVARLVKPLKEKYALKVIRQSLVIYSYDRRRSAWAEVKSIKTDLPDDYVSDEFFLPLDKQSFLDSELQTISISIAEKGMVIKTANDAQSRQAVVKRKAELSRDPPVPPYPALVSSATLPAKDFEELIRQVSCSALVRETKTEEDMRVNQVHFYSEKQCAFANARFYATLATLPGMAVDFSIISADLPLMRSFCAKLGDGMVEIGQDKLRSFIRDPLTNSLLTFSRVASNKPTLDPVIVALSEPKHEVIISVDRDQFSKILGWSAAAIEGTQRLTLSAFSDGSDGSGTMEFSSGKQELGRMQVQFRSGKRLSADFPVKYMSGIVKYLGEGAAFLKFAHPSAPDVLEISEESTDGTIRARHFIHSMVSR